MLYTYGCLNAIYIWMPECYIHMDTGMLYTYGCLNAIYIWIPECYIHMDA